MNKRNLKLAAVIALSAVTGLLSSSLADNNRHSVHQPQLQTNAGNSLPTDDVQAGRRQSNSDEPIDGVRVWGG